METNNITSQLKEAAPVIAMRRELTRYLLYTCLILFMSFLVANAQPSYVWSKQFSGPENIMPSAIAMDDSGNVYTTGVFEGSADFDPSPGTFTLSAQSASDVFVCKLNAGGGLVWCKQISGGGVSSTSIAVDPMKNIYVCGQFNGNTDFDPENTTFTIPVTAPSAFVLKLNPQGTFSWVKKLGGATGFTSAASITVNKNLNVWVTGYFSETADFDPGATDSTMTAAGPRDIFAVRLNSVGNLDWAVKMGGDGVDAAADVAVDVGENVYITGGFSGVADFDPGDAKFNLTSSGGPLDAFVCKLDKGGKFSWAKRLGGGSADAGMSVAVDNCNNVYSTGLFEGTADFDPADDADYPRTSAGASDIYVSKLSPSGTFMWVKTMGAQGADAGNSIMIDISGDVYVAGRFMDAVDFDPDNGTTMLTSAGQEDVFICKFDALGESLCAGRLGGNGTDVLGGMLVNPKDDVFTTGYFSNTADFDPTPASADLMSAGSYDGFVSRLGPGTCCRQIPDPIKAIANGESICMGESTKLNVVPGEQGTCPTWYWYADDCGGMALASGDTIVLAPTTTTTYYVRAMGACDTTKCESVTVTVKPKPTAYFEPVIEKKCDAIYIELKNYSSNADMYMWTFTGGKLSFMQNPKVKFEYDEPVTITLDATHNSGCKDSYTWSNHFYSFHYQYKMEVPNIFTPNGDAINDEFLIKYSGKIEDCFNMTVYDRWGGAVFSSDDPSFRWNGKAANGLQVSPGTYFWVVTIQDETYEGYVMIME